MSQPEAQTAVEAPSLPASFFAMHHVGSPTNVGEPEMTGATFEVPVHTGEPDDGPDAAADHPEIPLDDEPEDVEQQDADEDADDDDDGSFSPGGSLHGEVPDLNEWAWFPVRRSGSMRQEIDPDSVVDRDYDLYIADLDSNDSEYGSYFYASIATPPVEDLILYPLIDPKGLLASLVRNQCLNRGFCFIVNGF